MKSFHYAPCTESGALFLRICAHIINLVFIPFILEYVLTCGISTEYNVLVPQYCTVALVIILQALQIVKGQNTENAQYPESRRGDDYRGISGFLRFTTLPSRRPSEKLFKNNYTVGLHFERLSLFYRYGGDTNGRNYRIGTQSAK